MEADRFACSHLDHPSSGAWLRSTRPGEAGTHTQRKKAVCPLASSALPVPLLAGRYLSVPFNSVGSWGKASDHSSNVTFQGDRNRPGVQPWRAAGGALRFGCRAQSN